MVPDFLLAFAYPATKTWCIRKRGALQALCGSEPSADLTQVSDQYLKYENVCRICRAAYLFQHRQPAAGQKKVEEGG